MSYKKIYYKIMHKNLDTKIEIVYNSRLGVFCESTSDNAPLGSPIEINRSMKREIMDIKKLW